MVQGIFSARRGSWTGVRAWRLAAAPERTFHRLVIRGSLRVRCAKRAKIRSFSGKAGFSFDEFPQCTVSPLSAARSSAGPSRSGLWTAGGRPSSSWRLPDGNFVVAPGRYETEGFHDQPDRASKRRPVIGRYHHERQATPGQVLLITNVLIRGDHDLETGRLGNGQQLPVCDLVPTHFNRMPDVVARKQIAEIESKIVVKKDAGQALPYGRRRRQTARGLSPGPPRGCVKANRSPHRD